MLFWPSQSYRQSIHSLINKKTYMYMDKRTLMTIKKTVLLGLKPYLWHNHSVYINLLDIRLDILICLKITTVLIYNCMYIRSLLSTENTYMKMCYKIIGFLIICFKRNRCRNLIISFKINKKLVFKYSLKINLVT